VIRAISPHFVHGLSTPIAAAIAYRVRGGVETDGMGARPPARPLPRCRTEHGNAWEWVEDCWTPIASEIPTDGSAFSHPGRCEMGVIRGGSFASGARRPRSAERLPMTATVHAQNNGFRVALSIGD